LKLSYTKFLIYFSCLRPVFYFVSPLVSRASDFVILVFTYNKDFKVCKSVMPLINIQILYFSIMILSFLNFVIVNGNFNPKDLFEFLRPIFWIMALLLGANAARLIPREELLRIFFLIGLINSLFGILMLMFPKMMYPVYFIYNVPNLYFHGRPGGLAYTHTEFVAINALAILCILLSKSISRWYLIILLPASFVSMSKGGILLLFVFVAVSWIVSSLKSVVVIFSCMGAMIILFWTQFVHLATTYFPYLYWGFYQVYVVLTTGSTNDGSVGPRFQDWLIGINYKISDLAYFVGNSPMRNFPEISYIESTMPNIIFRFGYLGLVVFYGMYILIGFLVSRRDRTYVIPFLIAVTVADMTANFSESVKFLFLAGIVFGAMCEFARRNEHGR
jgi:hypothetical protein